MAVLENSGYLLSMVPAHADNPWSLARPQRVGLALRLLLICLLGIGFDLALAQAQISRDYQLKAGFLFNLAQFTEWPTNAFHDPKAPIIIGILGRDPFGTFLDDSVRDKTVDSHSLVVRRYRRAKEAQNCHVLFIASSEAPHLDEILNDLKGKRVLTVSDIEGSALRGVMIRMITENSTVRIRINLESVSQAGLTISSKLLRTSEIVPVGREP